MKIIEIKLVTNEDLPKILALDKLCFGGLWTEAGYQREIDSPNSCLLALLFKDSNPKLAGIGCFWSILEEAHVTLLGIAPEYRQQKLGKLLLCALLSRATNKYQLKRATLEVASSNQTALNLYQKFGFTIAGRRKNYYPKTGEDALILWRKAIDSREFKQKLNTWQQQISDRLYPNYIIENHC
ncbi:ribosomal protein S18-alanine N-acetyltransferase [Myxosarcina sp. GI1]|uniref:ribosomal protein S18-alanine N-acetyltransferase n=1 Tax=Myxosarcina sp. GI1 TaxID=1541065 RepID=UPI000564057F|nr:ribosomal protein S18-alanine N-acetyltransferase [Myxosarcina sp. GI1]